MKQNNSSKANLSNHAKPWCEEDILFLKSNYETMSNNDLGLHLGRSASAVKERALNIKISRSIEAVKLLLCRPNTGQFKKGVPAYNSLSDGAIVTRYYRKDQSHRKWIRSKGEWMPLSHYNWIQAGNTIPAGYCLWHKDKDTLNCAVSNLELITRSELMIRNQIWNLPQQQQSPKEKKIAAAISRENAKVALTRKSEEQEEVEKAFRKQFEKDWTAAIYELAAIKRREQREQREQYKKHRLENSAEAKVRVEEQKKVARDVDWAFKRKRKDREHISRAPRIIKPNDITGKMRVVIGNMTFFVNHGTDVAALRVKYDKQINPENYLGPSPSTKKKYHYDKKTIAQRA